MSDKIIKDDSSLEALKAWKNLRKKSLQLTDKVLDSSSSEALEEWKKLRNKSATYIPSTKSYPVGKFNNLSSIRLRWIEPQIFDFLPTKTNPFSFTRYNGETIEPRRMFTDGGSIPQIMRWAKQLDPWEYAPAYFLHDWLFELHYCHIAKGTLASEKYGFKETNRILLEAINTLRVYEISIASPLTFSLIDLAVTSFVAKKLWDVKSTMCPLPPDFEVE